MIRVTRRLTRPDKLFPDTTLFRSAPFAWDDARTNDRGKVMTAEQLEAGAEFARYKDVDGDGIPWRTWPGTNPDKGAYFTRGTSRNLQAQHSERGADHVYNMQRLLQKFETAKALGTPTAESRAG